MEEPKIEEVRRSICVIWENLQCPICLDLMSSPVSTKCDHQFCRFCIMKLLDSGGRRETSCPVCKAKVTKRSLQESPGFKRLVEGLKGLVQAFEEDSCVAYESTVSQKLESCGAVEGRCDDVQLEEGTTSERRPDESTADDSQSKGSDDGTTPSAKVKEGFARLMGLEDSCAITSDREDSESAVADFQHTSEGEPDKNSRSGHCGPEMQVPHLQFKKHVSADRENSQKRNGKKTLSADCPSFDRKDAGEEETIQHKKEAQISKGIEKAPSDPDTILDKRQKKSLEKVSEWLLNISPSATGKGGLDPSCSSQRDSEDCLSDGNTSSSTVKNDKDKAEPGNPKRSGHSLCLEEKVFGVTYKRGRRSTRPQLDRRSERLEAAEVSHPLPSPVGKTPTKAAKKRRSRELSPADFIKRPHVEPEDAHSADGPSGMELCETGEIDGKATKGCESLEGKEQLRVSPVFEVPPRKSTRANGTKMQGVLQEAGGDLVQTSEEAGGNGKGNNALSDKKCLSEKKRKTLARKRLSKGTKALDLVTVEMDPDPAFKPAKGIPFEADVQIDSYPSSEDRGNPGPQAFRRSERLKLFTEEVQGNRRKVLPKRFMKNAVSDCENGQGKNITAPDKAEKVVNSLTAETKRRGMDVKRNGCVALVDVSGIEMDESIVGENVAGCEQKLCHTETDQPLAVSSAEGLRVTLACTPVANDRPEPQIEQRPDAKVPVSTGNLTSELTDAELKLDGFDSELDTEQLLKTFKTTKRRSFCIGSPSNKCLDRGSFTSEKLSQGEMLNPVTKHSKEKVIGTPESLCVADSAELVQQDAGPLTLGLENHSVSTKTQASPSINVMPSTGSFNPTAHKVLSPKSSRVGCLRRSDSLLHVSPSKSKDPAEQLPLSAWENNRSQSDSGSNGTVKSNGVKFPVRKRSSARIISSEEVGPGLLFAASEEEPHSPSGRITEKPHPGLAKSTTPGDPSGAANVGACNLKVDTEPPVWGVNTLSTSSMTPDDLLPPNIVITASSRSAASSKSVDPAVELCSQINLSTRRRPLKLESSESEDSGEEDQLPSLAQLFGHATSHVEGLPPLDQKCPKKHSSGEPCLSEVPARCQSPCSEPEAVPASQASVDLFGTPEECEGGASGQGFSGDSSQFSGEIIDTQQKLAMQEELRRLQRMMVLVKEALHQKEGGCKLGTSPGSPSAGPSGALPCPTSPCGSRQRASISSPQTPRPGQALVSPAQNRTRDPVSALPGPVVPEVQQDEGSTTAEGDGDIGMATPERAGGGARPRQCGTGMPPGSAGTQRGPQSESRQPRPRPRSEAPRRPSRSPARCGEMVLVASGLNAAELSVLKKFAKKTGGSVFAEVTPETTHVIIKTDGELVCERTLKYFLGIAGRKWVVSFHWVTECFKQGRLLQEALFEVGGDMANGADHQGPMRARTTNDQKLLMRGCEISFWGSFTNMTTGQMEWMVQLCGATVVKDPSLFTADCKSKLQLVVVPGDSQTDYKAVQQGVTVVSRAWLLDSVATYSLQNPEDYKV